MNFFRASLRVASPSLKCVPYIHDAYGSNHLADLQSRSVLPCFNPNGRENWVRVSRTLPYIIVQTRKPFEKDTAHASRLHFWCRLRACVSCLGSPRLLLRASARLPACSARLACLPAFRPSGLLPFLGFRLGLRSLAFRLARSGSLGKATKTTFANGYSTPSKAFFVLPRLASLSVASPCLSPLPSLASPLPCTAFKVAR